jgi:SAP domain
MSSDFGRLTVAQLKIELEKRGAKVSGRKKELVERLEAYEKNCDFKYNSIVELPSSNPMPNWPSTNFASLTQSSHSEMPKLRAEHIEQYVLFRQVCDKASAEDKNSFRKGALMAKDNVIALSFLKDLFSNHSFFTGIVSAAMKKKVQYSVKFILNSETAEIQNSHCECPAGMGPHGTCKHLIAALMAVSDFVANKQLSIQQCCTSELQTFHHPKKLHNGSPLKAAQMGRGLAEEDNDPRPEKFRNLPGIQLSVLRLLYRIF